MSTAITANVKPTSFQRSFIGRGFQAIKKRKAPVSCDKQQLLGIEVHHEDGKYDSEDIQDVRPQVICIEDAHVNCNQRTDVDVSPGVPLRNSNRLGIVTDI